LMCWTGEERLRNHRRLRRVAYAAVAAEVWKSVELIVSDGLPAVVSAAADGVSSGAASAVPGALVPPSGGL